MSNLPSELYYAPSHEWVRTEDDGTVTVGITDHAQALLGDLVFVETPQIDSDIAAGVACAVVESVKAASDVYAPLSGVVIETNAQLAESPELVNTDPYGEGWIFKLKPAVSEELDELLDAVAYQAFIAEE